MWEQDDRHSLMNIASTAPLDKYHTMCSKCEATFAYLHGYKHTDGKWYCGKCYRDMEPMREYEDRESAFGNRGYRSDD